jgi:homoserine kinase type II
LEPLAAAGAAEFRIRPLYFNPNKACWPADESRQKSRTSMFDNRYDPTPVLSEYPVDFRPGAGSILPWHGGFSGSRIWRIEMADRILCLRRWPKERTEAAEIRQIHAWLQGVLQSGFRLFPVPIATSAGETVIRYDGYLWELTPWLPGKPVDCRSSEEVLTATRLSFTMIALAQFHQAVASDTKNRLPAGFAPGILNRLERLKQLCSGGLEQLAAAITNRRSVWPDLADRSVDGVIHFRAAADAVLASLHEAARLSVPIQPCIRDIHRDHVLFEDDRVTGIIDFGAMRPDSRAGDVARLLGSLAGGDRQLWEEGLAAYGRVFLLNRSESQLVRVYDASGVLLSAINWLQWIFVDGRQFDDQASVLLRFDEIAARLASLANRGGRLIV